MEEKSQFTKLSQVGIVVRDIRETMAAMERVFGQKPDKMGHVAPTNRIYCGESGDFDAMIALYDFAGIQIELIEPLEGRSIWREFLDQRGPGIHHIRFTVEDHDLAVGEMENKGIRVSQSGDSLTPGLRWAYFDSQDALGFIFELLSRYPDRDNGPEKR